MQLWCKPGFPPESLRERDPSEAAHSDNTQRAASEQSTGDGSNGPLAGLPRKTDLNDEVLVFLINGDCTVALPTAERLR